MRIENEITYDVRGAIYKVYNEFGPGLLESVYVSALHYVLSKMDRRIQREVGVPVFIDGEKLDVGFRLDLLVDQKVIIEVKSVEQLLNVHHKQVLTYLKLTRLRLAILVNFNVDNINEGIFRKIIDV